MQDVFSGQSIDLFLKKNSFEILMGQINALGTVMTVKNLMAYRMYTYVRVH